MLNQITARKKEKKKHLDCYRRRKCITGGISWGKTTIYWQKETKRKQK